MTFSTDFSDLDSREWEDLEDAAAALAEPQGWRRDLYGRWSNSFQALAALRDLVNMLDSDGVVVRNDRDLAGMAATFDSDGEGVQPDGLNITVLVPVKRPAGRFGVLLGIYVTDIDDLFQGRATTVSGQAEALAQVLTSLVKDAGQAA